VSGRDSDFIEVQRFRRWWIAVLLGITGAVVWWGFVTQIVLGRDWGGDPAPDAVVWLLWAVFGVGFPVWMWTLGVRTGVDGSGVHVRWIAFPLRRDFPFADIARHEAVTYQPIREFGGWGWRRGRQGRVAHTVRGVEGVELELRDGRRVLIGSQRPQELAAAISLRR
jgi:hypothetical protein